MLNIMFKNPIYPLRRALECLDAVRCELVEFGPISYFRIAHAWKNARQAIRPEKWANYQSLSAPYERALESMLRVFGNAVDGPRIASQFSNSFYITEAVIRDASNLDPKRTESLQGLLLRFSREFRADCREFLYGVSQDEVTLEQVIERERVAIGFPEAVQASSAELVPPVQEGFVRYLHVSHSDQDEVAEMLADGMNVWRVMGDNFTACPGGADFDYRNWGDRRTVLIADIPGKVDVIVSYIQDCLPGGISHHDFLSTRLPEADNPYNRARYKFDSRFVTGMLDRGKNVFIPRCDIMRNGGEPIYISEGLGSNVR